MNDAAIRELLHTYLASANKNVKDTIIVDELNLCSGLSRVDVAVINGSIHGYEIKSEEDTLNRLPGQVNYYNKSLEEITIVLNPVHFERVINIIPDWWGIITVGDKHEDNNFSKIRNASANPLIDGKSLLQLLWKEELQSTADKFGITLKKNYNKRTMNEVIFKNLDISIISQEVRSCLKSRKNWRNCSTTTVI